MPLSQAGELGDEGLVPSLQLPPRSVFGAGERAVFPFCRGPRRANLESKHPRRSMGAPSPISVLGATRDVSLSSHVARASKVAAISICSGAREGAFGNALDSSVVLGIVKRPHREVGLPASICNHSFRATGITLLQENGGETAARWRAMPTPGRAHSTTASGGVSASSRSSAFRSERMLAMFVSP
jgi:hypothetical protein